MKVSLCGLLRKIKIKFLLTIKKCIVVFTVMEIVIIYKLKYTTSFGKLVFLNKCVLLCVPYLHLQLFFFSPCCASIALHITVAN